MKRTLTKIIDFFRIDPTHGWTTIDLELTHEDLLADLDPGWATWEPTGSRTSRDLAA